MGLSRRDLLLGRVPEPPPKKEKPEPKREPLSAEKPPADESPPPWMTNVQS